MGIPVTSAQPTKLMSAVSACHVHATIIFLDIDLTVWANFGILLNPYLISHLIQISCIA
jgi:membrane-anchored protein YejM (alkaline phosphatase superfamily)